MRVATENYSRSRRTFKTTSAANTHEDDPMELDVLSRKRRGKGKSGKGKKGGKKGKECHDEKGYGESKVEHTQFDRKEKKATQAKVTEKRQQNTRDSSVNVETVERMDTKHLIVGTSSRPNLKVKARARESRNPK